MNEFLNVQNLQRVLETLQHMRVARSQQWTKECAVSAAYEEETSIPQR